MGGCYIVPIVRSLGRCLMFLMLPTGIYTHIENGVVNVYTQKEFNSLYKHNVWWSRAKKTLKL